MPLRLMVTSWRGLRVRMMRLMLIPVVSWRCRATARAAMTTVRCASMASRVWWKTGRALRSCLLIRKYCPGVPQLVIRGDHLTGAHQAGRNVGDVALEAHQGAGPGQGGLVQGGVTGVGGDEPGALGTSLAGDGWPGPGWPGRSGSECPWRRASWSRPTPPATTPDTRPDPRRAHDAC